MALTLGTNVGFVTVAPTADPAGTNVTIDGSSVVVKHTTPSNARRITEIGWYRGAGTNAANFEVALYSDLAGIAVTRLNVDNTNSSTVQGWITVAVDWDVTPSTAYWLAVQMDAHSGTSSIDSATSGGAGIDVLTSQTTLADPYGGGIVSDADGMYAIYALITVLPVLTTDPGIYNLTGEAAGVRKQSKVTSDPGSYAFTGQDVTLRKGYKFSLDPGAFAFTGQNITLTVQRKLTSDPASYSLTGQDATLPKGYAFSVTGGTFNFTGAAAALTVQRKLTASATSYTLTGQNAAFLRGLKVTVDAGGYSLTGQSPGLLRGLKLTSSEGVYILSGQAAGLLKASVIGGNNGSYSLTGQAINLLAQRILTALNGSYSFTGQDATLTYTPGGGGSFTLVAGAASYIFAGQNASLIISRLLSAEAGGFTFTGQSSGITKQSKLTADSNPYIFTGENASLLSSAGISVVLTAGLFYFNGREIKFEYTPRRGMIEVPISKKSGLVKAPIFRSRNKPINPLLYRSK